MAKDRQSAGRQETQAVYRAETHGVRVTAEPRFMEAESSHEQSRYFWAYAIEIVNLSGDVLQLLTRHWTITDGRGQVHEVSGEGVVGQQPVLRPGESFSYTSGCPLATPHGSMEGAYTMQDERGATFDVAVPLFPLDSPYVKKVLH
ncbi:Co2+/Mg2+ efflux protein ApaG [Bosea sp. (in: a-proteobacteria)]|uniref:Co2+/Mg2+ efflux protein ApaG n=1 Tax=Bosea sp. (in: a-proteobacteria) TaxID=1871050 RepID=UPI0011FFBC17|nr:Co2+/Mg2+ efflux protein ApaG [Bosea sp. (in: a-proteobacteria)]TAJ30330.1 MAG: Co2+/Mg2+ efflux protein ApaG [Bosea sp. (in: a-proteobacteria)]